ncbi:hypothetical protein EIN_418080 [Entamoeba invadens IP1]|uniref:tRNA (guanine(37)-N1)-methyltransferase n=1 Tax=Entamoeba invadens IP1 TaxID=370355 RepID=A0A0A1U1Q8_ENTIV|nr:hypothetical protein EIN_418080 [Entamoeba invadens IP1]ELP87959.1 hypothetical protein EIN_418080 [Entamoeba invadens IP1]|eukprot:XP_004254730.1 hypothetical protein EIN_418080 [Entamoeba invadens IP1]
MSTQTTDLPKTEFIHPSDFDVTETVPSIDVKSSEVSSYMLKLKGMCYTRVKFKCVVVKDPNTRTILLSKDFLDEVKKILPDISIGEAQVKLSISNFTLQEVMRKYIPKEITLPTSFETVGSLAHLNLKDEQMQYKHYIGEALLLKNFPRIKTVITKLEEITNEFRTFPLEVIAGEKSTEVQVVCHGVKFKLDFAECYWNSRLETEHTIIVGEMKKGETLIDAFAGVGPFAIPAALKGVLVYANDLNPASVKYMKINAEMNKATLNCECMDARDYMRKVVLELKVQPNFILMNLPATAVNFLDVIPELMLADCVIKCYGFSALKDATDLQEKAWELMKEKYPISVRVVRDVAPKKIMYCLSIHVTTLKRTSNGEEPETKRVL